MDSVEFWLIRSHDTYFTFSKRSIPVGKFDNDTDAKNKKDISAGNWDNLIEDELFGNVQFFGIIISPRKQTVAFLSERKTEPWVLSLVKESQNDTNEFVEKLKKFVEGTDIPFVIEPTDTESDAKTAIDQRKKMAFGEIDYLANKQ